MKKEFVILPAIDLKGGRCVRLRQGRPEDETVYGDDPAAMARRWLAEGARYLHIVDLDGAFEGRPVQLETVARIAAAVPVPIELGGGLRTDADIESARAAGVARAIVGTRACLAPGDVRRLVERHGDALAVGIDAREGSVQVRGWTESAGCRAVDLARRMADCGVRTLIVTEISRDGMLQGAAVESIDEICAAVPCGVIASGGVSTPEDVRRLVGLRRPNLVGAIVGKALYEGTTTLAELLTAAEGEHRPASGEPPPEAAN